ncbi:TPA: phosphatidylserine/phosphatidylglycerophosphate/cardiolipin synthase family protein [Legionella pneumophila]|nr:phosphatidylserine/phosphatidylglycerophosphate/cardiolipin synthase family protein [Legionella pneumophila]HAU1555091.1 phosphatidylserine/phosphatidylglycerophosphate/cardiolipin synthase family protein [Legionella pneumophila]HAU1698323.1 phosphatidylserine/phosphatidylglycerophosphate/cardiolipin synthase family protein [Legionella pneumophila]HAU1766197.1 phosphatidylserine/phosphatidylglycerophosphate/cardiolipin synthase family protein [Legionella pneumophila]HCD9516451.1 Lpg1888 fami
MLQFFEKGLQYSGEKISTDSYLMRKIVEAAIPSADKGTIAAEKMLGLVNPNQIEIVSGSESAYRLIVHKIKEAKKQILIQAFVWEPGTQVVKDIRNALCDIKHEVEVFLLVDQLDRLAQVFYHGEILPKKPKHDPACLGLDNLPQNIKLHIGTHVHNSIASNHNKAIWIDGDVILTGANFQQENYGPNGFHDAAMFIPSGAAEAVFYDFKAMWDKRTNKSDAPEISPIYTGLESTESYRNTNSCSVLYVTNTIRQKWALLPFYRAPLPEDPLNNAYMAAIKYAKHTIQIAVPNLNSPEIIHALADFINNRNGHVYLLMGKGFNDFRERFYGGTNQSAIDYFSSLLDEDRQNNLQVRWFHRVNNNENSMKKEVIHMKFMSIDGQVVIYGSSNLDLLSLHNSHETNIVIDNADFAQRAIEQLYLPIFETSIPVLISPKRTCCVCS